MKSQHIEFLKFVFGLREAYTSDTEAEIELLVNLSKNKNQIIEVGVFEGVASRAICQSMNSEGKLYLIDPYFSELKLEKILKISFAEYIAKQILKPWQSQVEFVKMTSIEAANTLKLKEKKADLIFIDARHDYDSVAEDFKSWVPMSCKDGIIAFHDSHICPARPDLNENVGSVRFVKEISEGKHGNWKVVEIVDSITAISAA
jgi:predicted O-methyltransferase YrrM